MSLHLSGLLDILRASRSYQTLLAQLERGNRSLQNNIVRSARPFLLAALANDWDGPIIFLTAAVRRATTSANSCRSGWKIARAYIASPNRPRFSMTVRPGTQVSFAIELIHWPPWRMRIAKSILSSLHQRAP